MLRHKAHVAGAIVKASEKREESIGESILARLEKLYQRGERVLDDAERSGDGRLAFQAIRETREVLAGVFALASKAAEAGGVGATEFRMTVGRCQQSTCKLCRPHRNNAGQVTGYRHHLAIVNVGGTGLTLPLDVQPYGPGASEYAAGQILLRRAVGSLGPRFADYVVVDGEFATAPILHAAGDLHLRVVARLKGNLPELSQAAQKRFNGQPPTSAFREGRGRVEVWDAADFDAWETPRWKTVRVLRYRQYKPDGTVCEAFWLTDFPPRQLGSRSLFRVWPRAVGRSRIKDSMTPRIATA